MLGRSVGQVLPLPVSLAVPVSALTPVSVFTVPVSVPESVVGLTVAGVLLLLQPNRAAEAQATAKRPLIRVVGAFIRPPYHGVARDSHVAGRPSREEASRIRRRRHAREGAEPSNRSGRADRAAPEQAASARAAPGPTARRERNTLGLNRRLAGEATGVESRKYAEFAGLRDGSAAAFGHVTRRRSAPSARLRSPHRGSRSTRSARTRTPTGCRSRRPRDQARTRPTRAGSPPSRSRARGWRSAPRGRCP